MPPTAPGEAERQALRPGALERLGRLSAGRVSFHAHDPGAGAFRQQSQLVQAAVAVGTVAALQKKDPLVTAYRDHGHALARGMDPKYCMAEMYGRIGGCAKGKGGSMHMFDRINNLYGGHGIVGAQTPLGPYAACDGDLCYSK